MKKAMISQVFTQKNQKESIKSAYLKLIKLNPDDPYKRHKAAGSLGGASRHEFIVRTNSEYTRVK